MISARRGRARVRLPAPPYTRESLKAASSVLPDGVDALWSSRVGGFDVELLWPGRPAARMRALAGDFLNETLSHLCRQVVVRFSRLATAPEIAALRERGFAAPDPDPLEELEPQVREDRRKELDVLEVRAREALRG